VMLGHIKLWRDDHAFPSCWSDDPIANGKAGLLRYQGQTLR